jgi:exosortase
MGNEKTRELVERTTSVPRTEAPLSGRLKQRNLLFALFLLATLVAFWPSVNALVHAGLKHDYCSQILIIPFLTAFLAYWRRDSIFREIQNGVGTASALLVAGLLVYWLAEHFQTSLGSYDSLSAATCGLVLIWIAGFVAIYGWRTFRAAAFPLGFLFLTVPIPTFLLNWSIFYLQSGSTAIANELFELVRVPVFRQGFYLSLPGLTIEVAKECSSIRSSVALVITCLLAGYLFLRSSWHRTALVLLAIPLSVLKNGVRIVTLSLLSIYVNPAFMTSDLHRDGGILFYLLALAILYPVFRWLEKSEKRGRKKLPE